MKKILIPLMVINAVTFSFSQAKQSGAIKNLSVEEFQQALDSLPDEVLLDLRTLDEIKRGKIANARQIDFFGPGFESALDKLDKNKVYFLYCGSGSRSGKTAKMMGSMGFKSIFNLDGGFTAWARNKMPVAKFKSNQ